MRTGLGPGSVARIWHVGRSGERGRAIPASTELKIVKQVHRYGLPSNQLTSQGKNHRHSTVQGVVNFVKYQYPLAETACATPRD